MNGATWTVRQILDYLAVYGGTVRVTDGKPWLDLPAHPVSASGRQIKRGNVVKRVVKHLRARRGEFLERSRADPRIVQAREQEEHARYLTLRIKRGKAEARAALRRLEKGEKELVERVRAELVGAVRARALAAGKPVWWMSLRPLCQRTGLTALPDTARFVCVQGDDKWTPLPQIVPDEAPPPVKAKRKAYQWTGG